MDLKSNRLSHSSDGEVGSPEGVVKTILTARFVAAMLFRLAQAVGRRSSFVASAVKQVNQLLTGCDIAWQASIGPGLVLYHPVGVVVGPHVVAGMNLRIQQGVTVGSDRVPGTEDNSPQIENGVVLGAGSRIIGPVVLGDRCVVGANAVVTSSVESGVTVVGVPARPIRSVS